MKNETIHPILTGELIDLAGTITGLGRDEMIVNGIVTQQDIVSENEPARRMDAARIFHVILRDYVGEKDEDDWSGAFALKDIYDCHTCVGHIAQVYAKGIMEDRGEVFGNAEPLSGDELKIIFARLFDRNLRQPPAPIQISYNKWSLSEYSEYSKKGENHTFIDLRDEAEVNSNPVAKDCIRLSLKSLEQNPYVFSNNVNDNIFILCGKGYKSALGARILKRAGFKHVTQVILQ